MGEAGSHLEPVSDPAKLSVKSYWLLGDAAHLCSGCWFNRICQLMLKVLKSSGWPGQLLLTGHLVCWFCTTAVSRERWWSWPWDAKGICTRLGETGFWAGAVCMWAGRLHQHRKETGSRGGKMPRAWARGEVLPWSSVGMCCWPSRAPCRDAGSLVLETVNPGFPLD